MEAELLAVDEAFNLVASYGAEVRPDFSDARVSSYLPLPGDTARNTSTSTVYNQGRRALRFTPLSATQAARLTPVSGLTNTASTQFRVLAGPLTRLRILSDTHLPQPPLSGAPIPAGSCAPLELSSQDDFGNPIAIDVAKSVTLQAQHGLFYGASDSNCSGGPIDNLTLPAGSSGAFFRYRSTQSGNSVLSATDTGSPALTGASATVSVSPGPATRLGFLAAPASGVAGTLLAPTPRIALQDEFGNTATAAASRPVTLSIESGPEGGTIDGVLSVTSSGGIATFPSLRIFRAGTYSLRATGDGLEAASLPSFTISPASPQKLNFLSGIATQTAGVSIPSASLRVAIQDAFGNTVPLGNPQEDAATIQLSFQTSPVGSSLLGTLLRPTVDGVATFDDVMIRMASHGYRLLATAAGSEAGWTPAASNVFQVQPNVPVSVGFRGGPTSAIVSRCSSELTISSLDAWGNLSPIGQSSRNIAVSTTASSAPTGQFFSSANCDPQSVVSQAELAAGTDSVRVHFLASAVQSTTLLATDTNTTPLRQGSRAFQVVADAPDHLHWKATPPSETAAGAPLVSQVEIHDQFHNPIPSNTSVALSLSGGPAGAALSGSTSDSVSDGVAAFFNTISRAGQNYVLTAQAPSLALASIQSPAFAIVPGASQKLVFSQSPSAAVAGAALSPAVALEVQDAYSNRTSWSGTITLRAGATSPTGAQLSIASSASWGNPLSTAVSAGAATFSQLRFNKAGAHTLVAEAPNLASAESDAFTIAQGAPAQLVLTGPASVTAGSCSAAFVLEVRDAYANPRDFEATTISLGGAGAGAFYAAADCTGQPITTLVLTAGEIKRNFYFRSTQAASHSIQATGTGLAAGSAALTVAPAAATQLALTAQPSAGASFTAGTAIPFQVEIRDSFGNRRSSDTLSISAAWESNPEQASLSGTTSVQATAGVASFSTLWVNRVGTGYSLRFSSGELASVASVGFSITPAAASTLAFVQAPPTSVIAGQNLAAFSVEARDPYGNRATGWSTAMTASFSVNSGWSQSGGGGSGGGTLTGGNATPSLGVGTFRELSINRSGVGYRLRIASGALTAVESQPLTVLAQTPPTRLQTPWAPASAVAGTCVELRIQSQDSLQNPSAPGNDLSLALAASGATEAALYSDSLCATAGITTTTLGAGEHTRSVYFRATRTGTLGLTIGSGSGLTAATASVAITAAAPSQLTWRVQPTANQSFVAGSSLLGSQGGLQVEIRDQFGNLTQDTATVQVALESGPSGASLGGTLSRNASAGVASFTGLWLGRVGSYRLRVSRSGLTALTTSVFSITPAAPAKLTITGAPLAGTAGTPLAPLAVEARDSYDNLTSGSTAPVSVVLVTGAFSTESTTTLAFAGGSATNQLSFDSLTVLTSGTYFLRAESNGLTSAASASFTVAASTPTQLLFVTPPSWVSAGQCQALTLQARDAYWNIAPTSQSRTLAVSAGNGAFYAQAGCGGSPLTSATLAAPNSSFVIYFRSTLPGPHLLQLSESGQSPALTASHPLEVRPGPVEQLSFSSPPPNEAVAGAVLPSVVVSALDAFGNLATQASGTVTLALDGGTFASGGGAVSWAAGTATFAGLSIQTAGSYTLTASGSGKTRKSNSFRIIPSMAARLDLLAQPGNVFAGATLAAVTVQARDTYGNPVTGLSGTIALQLVTGSFGTGTTSRPLTTLNPSGVPFSGAIFDDLRILQAGTYRLQATGSQAASSLASALSSPFVVYPGAADSTQSTLTVGSPRLAATVPGPGEEALDPERTTAQVEIQLRDAFQNPLVGLTPVLSVTGSDHNLQACSATNATGKSQCTLSSAREETKTVSFLQPPITNTTSVLFAGLAGYAGMSGQAPPGQELLIDLGEVTASTSAQAVFKNHSIAGVQAGTDYGFTLSGPQSAHWEIVAIGCTGTVAPLATCQLTVLFKVSSPVPQVPGEYSATLTVTRAAASGPVEIETRTLRAELASP
jgi:hypothetical protein